jgi:hypothetical protein
MTCPATGETLVCNALGGEWAEVFGKDDFSCCQSCRGPASTCAAFLANIVVGGCFEDCVAGLSVVNVAVTKTAMENLGCTAAEIKAVENAIEAAAERASSTGSVTEDEAARLGRVNMSAGIVALLCSLTLLAR